MDEGMPSEVALVCFFWWGYFGLGRIVLRWFALY